MTTKSNTLMAFTTVEDLTGTMETADLSRGCWPSAAPPCRKTPSSWPTAASLYKEEEADPPDRRGGAAPSTHYDAESILSVKTGSPHKVRPRDRRGKRPPSLWPDGAQSAQGPEMHKVENLLCNIFDGGNYQGLFPALRTPAKRMLCTAEYVGHQG